MTWIAILTGTLVAGIGSVWVAAALSAGLLGRYAQHLLSLAAGALLGTAFLHLLPEAFEKSTQPDRLFLTLLLGLVFFFILDKVELWHHGHEHHHAHGHDDTSGHGQSRTHGSVHHHGHSQGHGHGHQVAPSSGGWAVLAGDSVHCFGDGVLIASAFLADLRLGVLASVAVLAHEVPHHMGDLSVLSTAAGGTRRLALIKVSMAGAITALGGMAGWWLVEVLRDYLPYFLVIASSSFIYVALADLIPQLQKHLTPRGTMAQIVWLLAGIVVVTIASQLGVHHSA